MGKLEAVAAEAGSLRANFADISGERDRLQQEVKRLQAYLDDELRRKVSEGERRDAGQLARSNLFVRVS